VHGRPQATEISGHSLYLYPIFHPAAALYTPAMLTTLKEDVLRLPELLGHGAPQAAPAAAAAVPLTPPARAVDLPQEEPDDSPPAKPEQLGLF
jgi:DNA polymerase